MLKTPDKSNVYTQLRDRAEVQLQEGATPATGHWSMGVDALRLLHRLSSNPDNAEDALKLLHELQVHQVELDLQNEEIAANERALGEDIRLYQALFEYAPLGYLAVDLAGAVILGNHAAAELLGVALEDLQGYPVANLMNAQYRPPLLDLLQRVAKSGVRDSCVAGIGDGAKGSQHLLFLATLSPGREHILLAFCQCASAK